MDMEKEIGGKNTEIIRKDGHNKWRLVLNLLL